MADPPSAPVTQWLASGVTVVTGAAGVFGASTGSLGRVVRDHPVLATICLLVALGAVALGVVAPAVVEGIEDYFLVVGVIVLSLSTGTLGVFMARDQSLSQRPQASGALSTTATEVTVTGKVLANGLKSSEQMRIEVVKHTTSTKKTANLYTAFVGPDDDGRVEAPISIAATRGQFDRIIVSGEIIGKVDRLRASQPSVELCDSSLRYRGCAVMVVPRKPAA